MQYLKPCILYDAQCLFCKRFKQALEKIDTKPHFYYYDVNEEEVFQHFTFLDREECLEKVHLIKEDDIVLVGGDVVAEIGKSLPGISKLSWLLETDISKKTLNVFYETVNKMRTNSSICSKCKR